LVSEDAKLGNVVIEDNVEIGAGCTIDRGVTAETRIGFGTKMDNMVHIGHDTTVGKIVYSQLRLGLQVEQLLKTVLHFGGRLE
jgi:UDP-3-O-[3-hydroxymyristoyl] glucosamine N-acyltransferase